MDLILLIVGICLLVSAYRHRADFTLKYQLFLVFGILCLLPFAYGFYIGFTRARANTASPREIESLLSPATFQGEYPKDEVISLMQWCLKREKGRASYASGKAVPFCACLTEKRVQRFTLREQIEATNARWDPKVVPDALKKFTDIEVECTQSVLR